MELAVGQIIQLADGRRGIIRFAGQTQFAPGDWVGVELETSSGKNNGSVNGERYFDCPFNRGMFLRPSAVTVVGAVEDDDDGAAEPEEEAPPPPRLPHRASMTAPRPPVGASGAAARRTTVGSRPSSAYAGATAGSRSSLSGDSGLTKRMGINAPSPSPVPRSRTTSFTRSPTKSPTKQLGTAPLSRATSRTATPSNADSTSRVASSSVRPRPPAGGTRTSMGPPAVPASKTARPSQPGAVAGRPAPSASRPAAARSSMGKAVGMVRTGARPPGLRHASGDSGNESAGSSRITSARKARSSIDGRIMSPQRSSDDEIQPRSPVLARTAALEKLTTTTPKAAAAAASATRHAAGTSVSASASASASASSPAPARPTATNAAAQREIEDLKAKLRVLERKRLEDRDKLKQLDKLQTDCDKYQGIIQKIQAKYQPLQQENVDLRKQLKEAEVLLESVETMQSEHDSAMELATLDREMAEETSEVYKAELDAVKLKNEELELEVEILRSENAEFTQGMTNEEKTSAGWLQMERSNERLREALLRLRDITQQQEEELRDEVKALQEEVKELTAIKEQHETAKTKLSQAEAVVEDLRQQLDAAQAADDMIMDLTERNMSQAEQVEELKAVIEDLENLRDINDELEINHVQNERELQEEIDFKAAVIQEQARRSAQQEEALEDMEYALSRFREMVTSLQTDLEDMRASHAVTENESEQLNSKTRAMMDLNLKLHLSAAKAQVKTIDLELRRMEAEEAEQHLEIVKLFMPDVYLQTDRNSVLALLRFRRLAFKANLLNGFVRERINQPAHPGHEDDVFAGCDVTDKLTWVAAMCNRFAGAISRCSTEQFARFDGALYELEPVERALNVWIDGLRRDELKEKTCADELQRSIALMSHLAEVHITPDASGPKSSSADNLHVHNPSSVSVGGGGDDDDENSNQDLEGFADNLHMRAVLVQSHLESAAIALHTARAMVQRTIPSSDDEDEAAQHFARRTEMAISQTRSTKVVAGKAVRALEELKSRSLSLMPDTLEAFERCESASRVLSELARSVGFDLHALLHTEGRSEPYTYSEVQAAVRNTTLAVARTTTTSAIAVDANEDLFAAYMGKLRTVASQVSDVAALSSDLSQTLEFERVTPPWVIRGQETKAPKAVPVDAEEELRRLREEHTEARRLIARRDNDLDTAQLKIETLESKMRDAQSKAVVIAELEQAVAAEKTVVKQLKEDIEKQDRELKTLESERDRWKKAADEAEELEGDGRGDEDKSDASSSDDDRVRLSRKRVMSRQAKERAVESSETTALMRKEIYCLQTIIRYLREDNRRARITEQASQAWLLEPLLARSRQEEQKPRARAVATEARQVLGELVTMASSARVYDLGAQLPQDRLAWRPLKSSPRYQAAKMAEDYAAWKQWKDSVVHKAQDLTSAAAKSELASAGIKVIGTESLASRRLARKKHAAAARLQRTRLPGVDDDIGFDGKTIIVPPSKIQIAGDDAAKWWFMQVHTDGMSRPAVA